MKVPFSNFWNTSFYFLLLFGALFIPFPFRLIPFQFSFAQFLFGDLIALILERGGIVINNPEITSDSTALYALTFLLFAGAMALSLFLVFSKKWINYQEKIFAFIRLFLCYYLALQLMKYGCDKLFKAQFYLPEPNILYTPLGQISKDLLFWSTMGTSRSYNIFMGLLEVLPALFLLFSKTRLLGLLLALPVLTNIVAINFGFDISVKVYSLFLWILAFFLLAPYLKNLFDFLVLKRESILISPKSILPKRSFLKVSLKTFAISVIFLEALFPYFSTGQFNDDQSPRPYLHGAYEVIEASIGDQKIPLDSLTVKRIFVHRNSYLIFQYKEDQMRDFKLDIDLLNQQFFLSDYQQNQTTFHFQYFPEDSILYLQYFQEEKDFWLKTKALDWRKLPVLQPDFHWTIEAVE